MLASFLLALREGIEAALIIGIIFGVLRKMNKPQFSVIVWRGVAAAAALSVLSAVILNVVGTEFEGKGEQLFEGFAMLSAAALLTWAIFWMRKQSINVQQDLENDVRAATVSTSGGALFALSFLAVAREGLELALFLLAARLTSSPLNTYLGAGAGLLVAAGLGWLLFNSTRRLNLKQFFRVTNFLLVLFAAGLVGYGIHEFNEAGWIPAIIEPIYNINHLINDKGSIGLLLKALFGYNGNPSLTETFAYLGYFFSLGFILWGIPARKRGLIK
jgi:high-affinity iron transporter